MSPLTPLLRPMFTSICIWFAASTWLSNMISPTSKDSLIFNLSTSASVEVLGEIGLGWVNIYNKIKHFIFICNWKVGVYEVWKRWPPWNWKWMALIINVTSTLERHRGKDNVCQISTTSRGRIQDFFVEGVPTLQESTNIQFITFSKNTWNRENCGSYWEWALAPSVRHCKPYVIFGI